MGARHTLRRKCLIAAAAGAIFASSAHAGFRNWDPDTDASNNNFTTGAGLGGSGTWNNQITPNWTTPPAMPDSPWDDSAQDDAIFWGPGAGTVTLSSPRTARSLTIRTNGYVFNASTLTLAGGSGIIDVQAGTTTINSALAGSTGLTKSGSGTLVLATNASSFTGPINVNLGLLSIDDQSRLNSGASGTGTITISNGATLRNTNTSTAGVSFVSSGHDIALGSGGGTVSVPTGPLIYAGTITGAGRTLTKAGAGEFRYQGAGTANSTFSKLLVDEGTFRLGNVSGNNFETGFGAAPASFTADAITLDGGAIGTSFPVTLHANRGITLTAAGGFIDVRSGSMTVPGAISGPGGLTVRGLSAASQTLTLGGVNDFGGGVNVTDGTFLRISSDANLGAAGAPLTVTSGSLFTGAPAVVSSRNINMPGGGGYLGIGSGGATFGNLEGAGTATVSGNLTVNRLRTTGLGLHSNATLTITPGGGDAKVSIISNIIFTPGGRLDLKDNTLIFRSDFSSSPNSAGYSGVAGLISSAYAGGTWSGPGILTSMSDAAAPSVLTTLAIDHAFHALGLGPGQTTTWRGQSVSSGAVLVAYTYGGDVNFDGTIDGDDYFAIDSHINQPATKGYVNGDFNYDGGLNGDDYFIIDSNVSVAQAQPLGTALASVPEPSNLGAGFGLLLLSRLRRRRTPRRKG